MFLVFDLLFESYGTHAVPQSYLVLAGGLGSSEYVQAEIMEHYNQMKILFAEKSEDL